MGAWYSSSSRGHLGHQSHVAIPRRHHREMTGMRLLLADGDLGSPTAEGETHTFPNSGPSSFQSRRLTSIDRAWVAEPFINRANSGLSFDGISMRECEIAESPQRARCYMEGTPETLELAKPSSRLTVEKAQALARLLVVCVGRITVSIPR